MCLLLGQPLFAIWGCYMLYIHMQVSPEQSRQVGRGLSSSCCGATVGGSAGTESTKRPYSSLRPACLVPTPGSRAHAEAVHIPPQFPRSRAFRRVTLPRENDLLALQRESRCAWRSALLMLDAKGVRSGAASPSFPGSYIRAVPPQVPVGLCAQPPKFHKDTPLAGRAWTPGFPVLHPQLWPTPVLSLN